MQEEHRCEGCRRGQRRGESGVCEFCQEGAYQEIDNANGQVEPRTACKACAAGHYAPRIREWSHFSEWPGFLGRSCGVANEHGDPGACDVNKGWHVNLAQELDVNGKNSGIPQGLKLSIKGAGVISDPHGGHLRLSYRI